MSLLVNSSSLGIGTENFRLGLDGRFIREPPKEKGWADNMAEAFLDVPGAVYHNVASALGEGIAARLRTDPEEDAPSIVMQEDALSDMELLNPTDYLNKAAKRSEDDAKKHRRIVREDYTPDPEITGAASRLIYGFLTMGGTYGLTTLVTGNPIAGAGLYGVIEGTNEAGALRDKGVDDKTAFKAGLSKAVTSAVGMGIPAKLPLGSLNPNRWTNALHSAGANVTASEVEKFGIRQILENENYDDVARGYASFDPVDVGVEGAVSGLIGLAAGGRVRTKAQPLQKPKLSSEQTQSLTDALKSLQNRDRTTAASVTQMRSIAANPQYNRLRTSPLFTEGAPIVTYAEDIPSHRIGYEDTAATADGTEYPVYYAVVEAEDILTSNDINGQTVKEFSDPEVAGARAIAGNGRIAGIKEAYARGNAEKYRASLAMDYKRTGIPEGAVTELKHPVLVRVLAPEYVTKNLADKSNTSGIARMTLRERAKNDAARINLDQLEFDENGAITDDTVKGFISQLPAEERAELTTKDGRINKTAKDRVEAAIFAKAYNNDYLISLLTETDSVEARSVLKTLLQLAPKVASLSGSELNISESLVTAAGKIITGVKRRYKLKDIVAQRELDSDPIADSIVSLFAKDARSTKQVVETVTDLIEAIKTSSESGTGDLFGETKITKGDISGLFDRMIESRYPRVSEAQVDAARTKQLANAVDEDQPVGRTGNRNRSIQNEHKAIAAIDNGERVSVNEKVVDAEVIAREQAALVDAMYKVQEEAKGDPLEILAKIEPEDIEGMTIRRGWFRRINKEEAQAAEMSTPFGLVKVWLKHIKGERKPELEVTDDDLRQIPLIVRNYDPIPRSHEKETPRTWRVMHNGRELVLVDKPMEGDPTGKTLLSFFVQDPAKRETGRAKGAPLSRPRNPVPEVEGPATDTNARLSIFSSRSSGPSKDGGITTHSPRTNSRVKTNLADGIERSQEVRDATQGTNDAVQPQQNVVNQVVDALPEEVREPILQGLEALGVGKEASAQQRARVEQAATIEARARKALEENPDMELAGAGETEGRSRLTDLLEEAEESARKDELEASAQAEAMICVLRNGGLD